MDNSGDTVIGKPDLSDLEKVLSKFFIFLSLIFLGLSIFLSLINTNPGFPDSKANLDTARNILQGEGFTSHIVLQHFVKQSLPGPEMIRAPGIPYILAGLFAIFGVNYAVQVILNAVLVLLAAWCLRFTIALFRPGWFAELGGILILLSPNYYMVSILNNNFLVLWTILTFFLATFFLKRAMHPMIFAFFLGLLCASGFCIKQTFILSGIPIAILVLFILKGDMKMDTRKRILSFLLFLITLLTLLLPMMLRNQIYSGSVFFSPQPAYRLADRFLIPEIQAFRSVRYGNPVNMSELISIRGIAWVIGHEVLLWLTTAVKVIVLNIPLTLCAVSGLIAFREKLNWSLYVVAFLMMIEPLFSSLYWRPEIRYLWPIYPCVIMITGLLLDDIHRMKAPAFSGNFLMLSKKPLTILIVLSLLFGAAGAVKKWEHEFRHSQEPAPGWVEVSQKLPSDSVILTYDPWSTAWYSGHYAVMCPVGNRDDLIQVIEIYEPDYLLVSSSGFHGTNPPFEPDELEKVSSGRNASCDWILYKINLQNVLRKIVPSA